MSTPASPRPPCAGHAERAALIDALEIPDCDCRPARVPCGCGQPCDCPPHFQPCPHVLSADHSLSLEEWAELLLALDPDNYTDPPPPPEAPAVCSTEAVVSVYRQRASGRVRFHLYRPDDFWRTQGIDDRVRVGPLALHAANGYTVESGEVAIAGRIGPRNDEAPSLLDELFAEMGPLSRRLYEMGLACLERGAEIRRAA